MQPRFEFYILAACLALMASACGGGEGSPLRPTSQDSQPGGSTQTPARDIVPGGGLRGPVYVDTTEILIRESAPVQLVLHIKGNLPTPCHQLNYQISMADEAGNIEVELWSEALLGQDCIQVLEPFEQDIVLGSAEQGSFTIFVNGEEVGSIDI